MFGLDGGILIIVSFLGFLFCVMLFLAPFKLYAIHTTLKEILKELKSK